MSVLEEELRALLKQPVTDRKESEGLAELGIPKRRRSNAMLLVSVLLKKAKEGDANAFKELRAIVSQKGDGETQGDDGELAALIKGLLEED